MKRYVIPFVLFCATLAFASCGDNEDNDINVPTEEVVPGTNHNILIAYFSEPLTVCTWTLQYGGIYL